jgi:DNA-binding response OmpR family regulator
MKKILIIEDDHDLSDALRTKFVAEGYEVEVTDNSELGLKSVIAAKPDLIFLDIMTHSLHAATFLQRLRDLPESKNDSKVIVLTNVDNEIIRQKLEAFHIEAYMIKASTTLEELALKTKEALFGITI